METSINMDPTDPQFWEELLGLPGAFASFMGLVIVGLLAAFGKQTKAQDAERRQWLQLQVLVNKLSHLPQDVEEIKENQAGFAEALQELREGQVAMARDIEWLKDA